jgi:serine/threonine protein kinase
MSKTAFTRIMPVGKGGFGKVWKVELKRSKQIYAMKLMSKAKIINKKSVASVMN